MNAVQQKELPAQNRKCANCLEAEADRGAVNTTLPAQSSRRWLLSVLSLSPLAAMEDASPEPEAEDPAPAPRRRDGASNFLSTLFMSPSTRSMRSCARGGRRPAAKRNGPMPRTAAETDSTEEAPCHARSSRTPSIQAHRQKKKPGPTPLSPMPIGNAVPRWPVPDAKQRVLRRRRTHPTYPRVSGRSRTW